MRALLAFVFATLATSPAWAVTGHLPGGPKVMDCAKARDPARCEARVKARSVCRDKRGDDKRICMDAYVVSPDCARSDNPKRCAARVTAENACKGKSGKAHKACMQQKLRQK